MKESKQDEYYLKKEGNSYFQRNISKTDTPEIRDSKKIIFDEIKESGISFNKVLEYGCNYGDLLYYMKNKNGVQECIGVEASDEAIAFGEKLYSDSISFVNGTIANNKINDNPKFQNYFDLIIIDDVFGWVSRETLFQSMSNIDNTLKDGGFIFLRDFYSDKRTKNKNHHVSDESVFNYKLPESHASMLLASGIYEIEWQKIFYDKIGKVVNKPYKSDNPFNYRWADIILKKSYNEYFTESKKIE